MPSALMRRSVLTASLAAVATIASPLAGISFAAPPTLNAPSMSPTGTAVQDSQPTVSATYNDNLAQSSTITLKQGSTVLDCPQTVNGATISCTPSSLLLDNTAYTAAVHAVDAADTSVARDDTWSFTVDVPSRTGASPSPNTSVVTLPSNQVSVTFDE